MTQELLSRLTLILSLGFEFFILILLIRRHVNRRFFWFFVYISFQIFEAVVRLSTFGGNGNLYGKVYWTTDLADTIFLIVAFRESFLNALRPYTRLHWFFKAVWICVGLGLVYAVFRSWYMPSVYEPNREISAVVNVNVAVNYSLSLVGILYLALVAFLQIREHQWESAIILGFTVIFIVSSFAYVPFLKIRFGLLGRWLPGLAYVLAATIWAVGLWRPEPVVATPVKNLHEKDLELLNRYATIVDLIFKRKR
jgi:hypothetical protein